MLKPFSHRQKQVATWWMEGSPVCDRDMVVVEGAIRSGKTLATIDSFINWSQSQFQDENFIIAGVSVSAARRNVLEPLFDLLDKKDITYKWRASDKQLTIGSNNYYVFGANTEQSQDAIQGLTAAGSFADEVTLMPRSFVEQMMGRCSREGSRNWFTLNPSSPYHWFKEEIIDDYESRNALVLHFSMGDNPDLTPDTIERYKRMFTGLFYKRYIEGLWVIAEGAIYDMFDPDTHVMEVPKEADFYDERIVGVDYATSSVMTFGLYGIKGDTVYLIKEFYWDAQKKGAQKTDYQYVDDLKDFIEGWNVKCIYHDPSAASFARQCRHRNMHSLRYGKNEVVNGIRTVASKLQQGKYLIDRSCVETLREIQSYSWDRKAQELGEDRPIKKDDHAMDRDRYAIHTHLAKPSTHSIRKPRGF